MAKKPKQEQVEREVKLTDNLKLVISSFIDDDDNKHINIRKFYKTQRDPQWKPGRQGLTLPENKAKKSIQAMIECYKNIEDEAVKLEPRSEKKGKKDDE